MERDNHISRQKPSGSRSQNRTQNGRNSQREDPIGNKDITNRRIKCPDCDGRLPKEGSKSKSRVWKKVIWFARRNKSAKNDICQCHTDEGIHSSVEDRHSNSWSFTRSASRKFRISSWERQCKSESSKKSFQVRGKQDEPCTSHESSLPSTRTGSVCSSGANSPTATGSFCDFGATSHAGGRSSKRHKNTFVLTEIAREINPPVKNDSLPSSDIHPPPKRLSKSSSSVSHLSRRCMSPTSGNVRRSKSFPGSQSCISPSKRRFISTPNTPFGSFSPPLKQKCYGLRRSATFAGRLNTEFPKMCIKKSKSVNTAELTRLEKSTSLGEIRDQSGSIVGVVHFYKSPKKMARRMSSFNHKKDCTFKEEEFGYETIDQTNSNLISTTKEGSRAHLNKNSTISERDISLVAKRSSFNETSKRDCEETCKNEITTSSDSPLPLDRIFNIKTSLSLSSINEDINDACSSHDEPTLCDNEPGALGVLYNNESVQKLGLDFNNDHNVKNVIGNNYVGSDSDVLGVVNNNCVVQETKNASGNSNVNTTDSSYPFGCVASLSSMTIQETVTENVSDIEKIIQNEPGSMKDESLCSALLSKDETSNISTVSETSALAHDDCISSSSCHENDLFTEQPSTSGTSQQISENVQLLCYPQDCLSDTCRGCAHHHRNQLLTEPPPSLPTSEQISEDVYLPYQHDDHVSNNCNGCGLHHGNHLLTEPPSLLATSEQISGNVKSSCDCTGDVSGNCNGNHLLTKCKSHHEISEELVESEGKIVSNANKQCINDVAKNALNSCALDMNETCVDDASFLEESEDSFCSDSACQSNINTDYDRCLESEISVDGTLLPEINHDSIYSNDTCQSNKSSCGDGCLESELKITEQVDGLTDERDLEFSNDTKLSHNCPCIMPESDLTLEAFDNQINTNSIVTPVMSREKFQTRVHSTKLASSEKKPNSPTKNTESMNDQIDLYCENLGNVATTVIPNEEFQIRGHSRSLTSPDVLECSRTSDYVSMFDESFSPSQNDVSIHTWKTSESDLKSDEIGLPVPGETFKMRTELMLSWFEEFNDEQRNITLKKILNCCELPQMHLLSVAMENNLHKTCPPNCQDMLVWLPYTVTLEILSYLDPVSLCRCNQVNRAWNELTDNPLLWQRLTRNPDYQLSEASSNRQYQKFTQANGEIQWKKVFAERFLLQRNWLDGKYKLRTFEGHNQGIACVQFDDTRIVSGSSDKTIKLWDISNTPSELMLTLEGHSGTVRCLDLNGNRLVSGSTDRTIKVWDLSFASYWAGASCKVTMVGHLHTVRCLQADEKKLVSGSYDKTVKVWDLKTGECQLTLRGHTAAVLCVQFDDQKIVSGSYDKKIKVWDLTEGTCLMTLDGHQDAVTCLNLTHDGMKIITGSLDYSLKFWDLSTGKCYGTLDWITSEGHTAVVRCLQVDSWRIVSGGDDKTLKVWELATGQRLLTLRYHSDGVTCMQFNDFAIVSGSYDRTVKLWDFTPEHQYLEAVT